MQSCEDMLSLKNTAPWRISAVWCLLEMVAPRWIRLPLFLIFWAKDHTRPIRAGKLGRRMQIKVAMPRICSSWHFLPTSEHWKISKSEPVFRSVTTSPNTKSTWDMKKNFSSLNWPNHPVILWAGLLALDREGNWSFNAVANGSKPMIEFFYDSFH